jgi:serine/threonine-protein kinase HipA
MSRSVYVFADWEELDKPTLVGTLRSSAIKNKEHFTRFRSFYAEQGGW